MGLSAGAVACSKESARPENVPTASATPSATATPSVTAATVATQTPTPLATADRPTGGGGCGFDVVCNPQKGGQCAPSFTEPKRNDGVEPRTGSLYNEAPQHKPGDCCYKLARGSCGGGRPLRADDGPIIAPFVARADWIRGDLASVPAAHDAALAERWFIEASFEHASVASFARVSLQLLALGAPPDLLVDTQRAALEEIEHTTTFLALAERRGGGKQGPGALDVARAPLATSFASFVEGTFLDGCVAETVCGIEIRTRAEDGDDVERSALASIADDEERHAELAWRMLAWAVRTGGAPARAALEEAIGRIEEPGPIVRDVVLPCARALLESRRHDDRFFDARA